MFYVMRNFMSIRRLKYSITYFLMFKTRQVILKLSLNLWFEYSVIISKLRGYMLRDSRD